MFPDTKAATSRSRKANRSPFTTGEGLDEESVIYPDSGSAARFFFSTKGDYNEGIWHDLNLHPKCADIAGPGSHQQSQSDASVLVHVLNLALQEALRCVGLSVERSMTVTANESRLLAESVTQATLSIGQRFWQELSPESISLNLNPVNVVATHEPTGTTTITVSHWKSDGSAEPVTFNIMRKNLELGERDSNGKSFIYCAKASKSERNAGLGDLTASHPTVKPLALMRYLVKLVTPPDGTVLDPFLGSGTTAVAAILEGFDWMGCEMTDDYWPIIEGRVEWAQKQAEEEKAKAVERLF